MDIPVSNTFDQRLRRLRHEYKVLWTYYQMAQSLMRTLLKLRRLEDIGLGEIFQQLREVESQVSLPAEILDQRLQIIEGQLQRARYILTEFDSNISPGVIRRYIDRVDQIDDRFLILLIQFNLGKPMLTQDDWDKVDLLLTKLTVIRGRTTGQYELRPEAEILRLRDRITEYYTVPLAPPEQVHQLVAEAEAIAAEVRKVTSYLDLLEWGLLARIREFKKRVHPLMLHPQVIIPFLRLNVTTKRKFMALYQHEIERIHASIQMLERSEFGETVPEEPSPPVETRTEAPPALPAEGEEFVQVLASLERRMQSLSEMLQSLLEREPRGGTPGSAARSITPELAELSDADVMAVPSLVQPALEEFLRVMDRTNWRRSLSEIAFSPPLRPYAMEPGEVESFQQGFLQSNVPRETRICHRLVVMGVVLRYIMSQMARQILEQQEKAQDGWVQRLSPSFIQEIREILSLSEVYERYLAEWEAYQSADLGIRRRLSRALRKLQRARVGLSLLYDQVEEVWLLQRGALPEPSPDRPTVPVRWRPQPSPLVWAGWVVAFVNFIILILFLITKG